MAGGNRIPGLEAEAEPGLERVIAQLEKRLRALEQKPVARQTQTRDFFAREGETITIEAPSSCINGTLVKANKFNKGARVTFIQLTSTPVRYFAVDGLVNGVPSVLSNAPGTYVAISDGQTGWSFDQNITAAGVVGAPGTPGFIGSQGPPGNDGAPGDPGETGPPGPPGASVAGSAGQPGPQGEPGDAGESGPPGATGASGVAGAAGVPLQGDPGERGEDGVPGQRGATGPQGPMGPPGMDGEQGSQGETGPTGQGFADGDKDEITVSGGGTSMVVKRSTNFTWSGTHKFASTVDLDHQLRLNGVVQPLIGVGAINNLPIGNVTVVWLNFGATDQEIRGIVPPTAGERCLILVLNVSLFRGKLIHISGSTAAGNTMLLTDSRDLFLQPFAGVWLWYDGTQWFSVATSPVFALKADQEAATSITRVVTPAVQHQHPGSAKFWVHADLAGGILASYNVQTVTDTGVGILTVTTSNDFSSANWCCLVSIDGNDASIDAANDIAVCMVEPASRTTGSVSVICAIPGAAAASDPFLWNVVGFGDF